MAAGHVTLVFWTEQVSEKQRYRKVGRECKNGAERISGKIHMRPEI
jgi:hypothetical protein